MSKTTYGYKKLPAAFTPGRPFPICPKCWSTPKIGWKGNTTEPLPDIDLGYTQRDHRLAVYGCSNPPCKTAITFPFSLAFSPIYTLDSVLQGQLRGEDADRFESGHHNSEGIWVEGPAPPKADPFAKRKRSQEEEPVPVETVPEKKPRKTRGPAKASKGSKAQAAKAQSKTPKAKRTRKAGKP